MTGFYWERHPDGPFATLIAVTATYCSPDADAEDYERLKRLAERDDDQRMRVFKEELRQALADPSQLPEDELDNAVEFTDENEAAFRATLAGLYGDGLTEAAHRHGSGSHVFCGAPVHYETSTWLGDAGGRGASA